LTAAYGEGIQPKYVRIWDIGKKLSVNSIVIESIKRLTAIPLAKNLDCMMRAVPVETLDLFSLTFPDHNL
jgi:hypothetical protein